MPTAEQKPRCCLNDQPGPIFAVEAYGFNFVVFGVILKFAAQQLAGKRYSGNGAARLNNDIESAVSEPQKTLLGVGVRKVDDRSSTGFFRLVKTICINIADHDFASVHPQEKCGKLTDHTLSDNDGSIFLSGGNALPEIIQPFSRKAVCFFGRDNTLPEIICPHREQILKEKSFL